jgi:putative CocE/NonD family hydrolase
MTTNRWRRTLLTAATLATLPLAAGAQTPGYQFGACRNPSPPDYRTGELSSTYLTMPDGVRIAVDIVLPDGAPTGTKFPTVLQITRYWRAGEGDPPNPMQQFLTRHGYATVWMDVRGTGASGGKWRRSRSTAETRDYADVAEWIARQPWSNGKIAGWGISYGANAADFLAIEAGRRITATLPLFPDFDGYDDLILPGGVFHEAFGKLWSEGVKAQDRNEPRPGPAGTPRGVRRVGSDTDGRELASYLALRDTVPGIYEGYRQIVYKNDNPPGWDGGLDRRSTHAHLRRLEAVRGTYTWASWLDAGTANGAIHRFATVKGPQRVVIGAWSHAARFSASPYQPADAPLAPTIEEQRQEQLCFLDQWLGGRDNGMHERLLIYYTLGEDAWKTTKVWPPAGFRTSRYFFEADRRLSRRSPTVAIGADRYQVDFEATTGTTNRWHTQRGGGDVIYPDRVQADRRLLVYDTEPLARDVEITGTPVIGLLVRASQEDGAFFVYLEDVAPDGRVTYLTEGQLRGIHRQIATSAPYRVFAPHHTFHRRDAAPMRPERLTEITFGLLPTSVLIRKGHRIRVAIGGADKDTFVRIPATGDAAFAIERNETNSSWISLPLRDR